MRSIHSKIQRRSISESIVHQCVCLLVRILCLMCVTKWPLFNQYTNRLYNVWPRSIYLCDETLFVHFPSLRFFGSAFFFLSSFDLIIHELHFSFYFLLYKRRFSSIIKCTAIFFLAPHNELHIECLFHSFIL